MEQLAFAPRVQVLDASVPHDDATVSLLLPATLRKKQVVKEEAEATARKDLFTLGEEGGCRADDLPPHRIQQRSAESSADTSQAVKKCVKCSRALSLSHDRVQQCVGQSAVPQSFEEVVELPKTVSSNSFQQHPSHKWWTYLVLRALWMISWVPCIQQHIGRHFATSSLATLEEVIAAGQEVFHTFPQKRASCASHCIAEMMSESRPSTSRACGSSESTSSLPQLRGQAV